MPTTRIVTLNELLTLMKNFVTAHPQMRDFGYGPTSDIGTSRQMQFPYLWATHQSDSYIRIDNKTAIPELKIVLLFMDQVNDQNLTDGAAGEDSDNGQEIMSDTLQYLQDCVTEIEINWGQYGLKIAEDVRIFPAFDETTDKVNGWAAEVTFRMSYINCEIPS